MQTIACSFCHASDDAPHASYGFMRGLLLAMTMCIGCDSGGIDADAQSYARIESKVIASMRKADKMRANGDENGYLAETLDGTAISMEMDKIRKKYSGSRDAEFMQAVEKAKASMR